MNEAKEILDALPKSREYYTTVRSAELARLREIAGCFRLTDSTNLEEILDSFRLHGEKMGGVYADCILRLQAAAKLAEDGA